MIVAAQPSRTMTPFNTEVRSFSFGAWNGFLAKSLESESPPPTRLREGKFRDTNDAYDSSSSEVYVRLRNY